MKNLNYWTLLIFAPILILTGIPGFILPDGLLSNAAPYNIFHIIFGVIGLICVISRKNYLIRGSNSSFSLIEIKQAVASYLKRFPQNYFQ